MHTYVHTYTHTRTCIHTHTPTYVRTYDAGGALDSYRRRMMTESDKALERLAAEKAEAKYRDKHAFVGEHYNDI